MDPRNNRFYREAPPAPIFVTKYRGEFGADGQVHQIHDVVNFPGIEVVVTPNNCQGELSERFQFNGGCYGTVDEAAAAWRTERARLTVRDRIAETLRRWKHGLMRPLWSELPEVDRQRWREAADVFSRVAADCNLDISPKEQLP